MYKTWLLSPLRLRASLTPTAPSPDAARPRGTSPSDHRIRPLSIIGLHAASLRAARRPPSAFRRGLEISDYLRVSAMVSARDGERIVGVAPAARGRPAAVVTRSPRLVSRVPTPYPLPSPLAPRVAPAPCPWLRGVGSGRLGCRTGARHGPRARATPRVACLSMY